GWRNDLASTGWADAHGKATMGRLANGFYANFVFNDPKWDFSKFDIDKDPVVAQKSLGKALNATDPNLSAFRAHNGKILEFHGLSDGEGPPLGAMDYSQRVVAAQARTGGVTPVAAKSPDPAALKKTQDFYRLFLAPGMSHCAGGPGPNLFGQTGGNG